MKPRALLHALVLASLSIAPGVQAQIPAAGSHDPASQVVGGPLAAASAASVRMTGRVWRADGSAEAGERDASWSDDPRVLERGRALYESGIRADGSPLQGDRLEGQIRMSGAAAACVLCHRRSGLGGVEGVEQIAPISGRYLFDQDMRARVNLSFRSGKSQNARHEPFDINTLAKAVRAGVHIDGHALAPLMPHYDLSDEEVFALGSYLRRLSNSWSPGVDERDIHMATVITPDVDPQRRRIFLETIRTAVQQKNGSVSRGTRTMASAGALVLQTDRNWTLHVWELKGPAHTWASQLEGFARERPVFALISGLGAGTWAPVHQFCESKLLPCWFPSVGAVPTESENGFYSLYFSRGVGLEADVMARVISHKTQSVLRGTRLVQIYVDEDVAAAAVRPLAAQLADSAMTLQTIKVSTDDPESARRTLRRVFSELRSEDHVVTWLTPGQWRLMDGVKPPVSSVYAATSMGVGDGGSLPESWRPGVYLTYPYQLPALRKQGMTVFHEWLKTRGLALEDEVLQSEVYFSLSYLNDTLVDMLDNLHRDYLVERGESMLSLRERTKGEEEARDLSLARAHLASGAQPLRTIGSRPMIVRDIPRAGIVPDAQLMPAMSLATASPQEVARRAADPYRAYSQPSGADRPISSPAGWTPAVLVRTEADAPEQVSNPIEAVHVGSAPHLGAGTGAPLSTNVYPGLSLGQFQRHASKGAYVVRLADTAGRKIEPVSDWVTP